jgi:20S proteasome alpha/beta subunit
MTLVLALSGPERMVLGSDSRGTFENEAGARVEINTMKKIIPVAKHVVILLYGNANEGIYLVKRFKFLNKRIDGVSNVAEGFAKFCKSEMKKTKDVPHHPNYFPNFGFIVAGLDTEGRTRIYRTPRTYNLGSVNGFRLGRPDPFGFGGKPFIALYLYAQRFQSQRTHEEMLLDDMCKFVAQCIYDTMSIDGDVGGKIHLAIIDRVGFREMPEQDVRRRIQQWAQPLI